MATFTDENSALGNLGSTNRPAIVSLITPVSVGIIIAIITFLTCRDTGAHSICIPSGLVAGIVIMSLCFMSEKERQMLIESDETYVSQQDLAKPKSDSGLWLKLQCLFLASAVPIFLGLIFFGDPVFQLYLDAKGAYPF